MPGFLGGTTEKNTQWWDLTLREPHYALIMASACWVGQPLLKNKQGGEIGADSCITFQLLFKLPANNQSPYLARLGHVLCIHQVRNDFVQNSQNVGFWAKSCLLHWTQSILCEMQWVWCKGSVCFAQETRVLLTQVTGRKLWNMERGQDVNAQFFSIVGQRRNVHAHYIFILVNVFWVAALIPPPNVTLTGSEGPQMPHKWNRI